MVRFSDVLTIVNGRNQKNVENKNGQYPIYGSGGIMGYADKYLCEADTVIIGRKGSINNPIYVKEPFWNVDTAFGLVADKTVLLPKYLYYFCVKFDFNALNTTVTIPSLTKANLLNIEMVLPTIEEQTIVVNSLDKIVNIIDMRKQQLQKLDELVKARFVEMFGDVIRNERGWKQYKFSDVSQSRLGKMLDTKQQTGKYKYPYLANFNVQWFKIRTDNLNEMDFSDADKEEFELIDGDLLICEGGEIGRCAVWHNEIQPCYFQKALHRVRCNRSIILPDYMAYWFKYNCDNNGFAEVEGAMSTIPHLTGAKLKSLKITVPSIELQEEFVALLKLVDKSKLHVQKSLDKLEILKKALMQKYFG